MNDCYETSCIMYFTIQSEDMKEIPKASTILSYLNKIRERSVFLKRIYNDMKSFEM